MEQNQVGNLFHFANQKACELAIKAKEISKKNILIAGSLPAQNDTYEVDNRDKNKIEKNFFDQASIINPYIDFFYLDVLSSGREVEIATSIMDNLNKLVLVGLHIKKNGKLPSGETITNVVKKYKNARWLGVVAACVSLEIIEKISEGSLLSYHSILRDNFLLYEVKYRNELFENIKKSNEIKHICTISKDNIQLSIDEHIPVNNDVLVLLVEAKYSYILEKFINDY